MNTSLPDDPVVRMLDPGEKRKPPPRERKKANQETTGRKPLQTAAPQKVPKPNSARPTVAVVSEVAGKPVAEEPSLDWIGNKIKKFSWAKCKALALYWAWTGPVKAIFAVIYIAIIRDGFVNLTPTFAMRLSRIPGLGFLDSSETFYKADVAIVLSAFLFVVVTYCWSAVFRLWTSGERRGFENEDAKYASRFESLIVCLSALVVIAELLLFYLAINDSTWGGGVFSFTALLASAAFVGVLLGVILIGIHLEKNVTNLGEKK